MVLTVPIQQAGLRLTDLVHDLALGDEIVLTDAGRSLARIIPEPSVGQVRQPGACKGMLEILDDGNDAILEQFEGYVP